MKNITINLENCYGIHKLQYEFDFSDSSAYSIYAPNGFMKTSLSKTFDDISKGRQTQDIIFPERVTLRDVKDGLGNDIAGENIFVIEPYNQDFTSEKTSLLLVNRDIKKKYDKALKGIAEKQEALLRELKQLSGLTGRSVTPETELLKCFSSNSLLDLLESFSDQVNAGSAGMLATVVYAEIFNDKTIALLESGQIKTQLKEYIEKYNELVEQSPILSKGFNHYHAGVIQKNLADNGFFAANHSVNLRNGANDEKIASAEDLAKKFDAEKQKILSNQDLAKKFDAIDKKIANAELRKFRDYLFDNKDILAQLENYKQLQKDIWLAYLCRQKESFVELVTEYRNGKEVISASIDAAKKEKTDWEEVVKIFNKRFAVPFRMEVSNQDDVILKGSAPQISFIFDDVDKQGVVGRETLLKVLSQGEKRALYILNILFEINVRKKQGTPTLLIVDDIADSFDYKNKYAIVEYLKEISKPGLFHSIFLSHNFDFHRTVCSRLSINGPMRLFAVKQGRNLKLAQELYQNDPFKYWKRNLEKPRFCISAIPFVRNLAEYCGLSDEYGLLTSLLHIKAASQNITCGMLESIYKKVLTDKAAFALPDHGKSVISLIFETAESIMQEGPDVAELESKIVLSIAIRLKAEQFMMRKIADQPFFDGIKKNQTIALLERFKIDFEGEIKAIEMLEQVNLMTPENIHLNSFMYEPILDMGSGHLRSLYAEVLALV